MDLYQIFITHNRAWALQEVIIFLILFFCAIGAAYILVRKKKIYLSQAVSGLAMLLFLGAVFGSTVFTREPKPYYEYKLELFWSWRAVANGGSDILRENLLNMALLLPVGGLLPWVLHRKVSWWKGFLVGFGISAAIELSQLIFRRGLFEWDDMIHNGIGCMVGCLGMNIVMEKFAKKKTS